MAGLKRLLAVDCSTWWGSVALVEQTPEGAAVVCDEGQRVERSHSVGILDWVDRALAQAGWSKSQLDGFAATIHDSGGAGCVIYST